MFIKSLKHRKRSCKGNRNREKKKYDDDDEDGDDDGYDEKKNALYIDFNSVSIEKLFA